MFIFAVVFFTIFFVSLAYRSIFYNIIVSVAFLLKIFIGLHFYRQPSVRSLRNYFLCRYLFDLAVLLPIIVVFKLYSPTYMLNYLLTLGLLLLSEAIITLVYVRELCFKEYAENLENVKGSKIL